MEQEEVRRKKEVLRTVKFALFSTSAGIIEISAFALMENLTSFSYRVCYLTALVLSVLWNFTLNRHYTFRSAGNVPVAMAKVALFYLIFTPLSTFGGDYLVESCGWNDYLVTGLAMGCNFVTEYLYDRFFVFGASLDTNERARKETSNNSEIILK